MNATLNIGQTVGGFRIEEFLKTSTDYYYESYFVTDNEGGKALMKVFAANVNLSSIEFETIDELAKSSSLIPIIANGNVSVNGTEHRYIVRKFVDGKHLFELIAEGKRYSWEEAFPIIQQVLIGLKHLHSQEPAIIHNDITTRNIIVKDSGAMTEAYIIGMGHLSHRCNGKATFSTKDLNSWYRAPETFNGIYDEQSDIFSVGALFHTMLRGFAPWGVVADDVEPEVNKVQLKHIRLNDDLVDEIQITEGQKRVLRKMLALDYDKRFRKVTDVLSAMNDESTRCSEEGDSNKFDMDLQHHSAGKEDVSVGKCIQQQIGGGFADVAGMADVKNMLYKDVMFVMQNKEKAEKYRLKVPNGALFYGPPGCGKTFIAEKFAEESHLNFMMVKTSDLGSIYIHGTQGKIADLFDEAAKKAPTVICFDELDGMVPNRANINNEGASGEVNEFLSQLNNCSERGIFVIGTSNRPEKIDPAILRTGRMDKMIYIPMPDVEARKELFKIHLDGRYCDESINLDELAKQSDGYVASDISFMVNSSALEAAMSDVPISQELVLAEIHKARRSVSQDDAVDYERIRKKFEQQTSRQERRRIGF